VIQRGLFQAPSVSRKRFSRKRAETSDSSRAKTGIGGVVHFGSSRISLLLLTASSQKVEGNSPTP
jgi:hypothetical protein